MLKNKKLVKKILQFGIFVFVFVLIYLSLRNNLDDVKNYEIKDWPTLIISVLVFSLVVALNSFIWHLMMLFSGEKINTLDSIHTYISSYIIRYIPGNVWAVFARALNNKENGVPIMKSVWGWLFENLGYLYVAFLYSLFTLGIILGQNKSLMWIVMGGLIIGAPFIFKYEWLAVIFNKVIKKKLPESVQNETGTLELSLKQKVIIMLSYVFTWLVYSFNFFLVMKATVGANWSDFFVLAGVNALAWAIGYVSIITPSGSGVREGIFIVALTTLGLTGKADAVIIAIIARITTVIGELIYFALIKLIYFIFRRNAKSKQSAIQKSES
ncbi:flippase-like domain-containing protein [Candidatus Dojkabacteria bacterium]|nr:flippase-like domain-containing protein [Candidatus Dojkabacteria bacterium]